MISMNNLETELLMITVLNHNLRMIKLFRIHSYFSKFFSIILLLTVLISHIYLFYIVAVFKLCFNRAHIIMGSVADVQNLILYC